MSRKAAAICLSAALWWSGLAPAFAEEADWGGAARAPAPSPVPALLAQLPALSALERVERLERLSATEPAALALAAVAAEPGLLKSRVARLETIVGAQHVPALAAAALSLHLEARADEAAAARLRELVGAGSPEDLLEAARRFDGAGRAPQLGAPARPLAPAAVELVAGASRAPRAVHTLSTDGRRLLINGAEADAYRAARAEDGATRELYIHPENPGLLVRVYHSADSLAGFERKNAALESLAPLSAAGAAAKVLEHGEAVVPGRGRVYFLVQELVEGVKLAELPADKSPVAALSQLFDRLRDAGLAVEVPGPTLSSLLSRVLLSGTPGGGLRAYLTGGLVRSLEPAALAAHDEMLRAMLRVMAAAAPARAPVERLGALTGGAEAAGKVLFSARAGASPAAIAARRGLDAAALEAADAAGFSALRAGDETAAAAAAAALLEDPDVAQVKVHRRTRAALERRGHRDLPALLALLREPARRQAVIAKAPDRVWAQASPETVEAALALLASPVDLSAVPGAAWRRLAPEAAIRLAKRWDADAAGSEALGAWARAGGEASPDELLRAVAALPKGEGRDGVLRALTAERWRALTGPQAAALLQLTNQRATIEKLEAPAWSALGPADLASLLRAFNVETAKIAVERWLAHNAPRLPRLREEGRPLLESLAAYEKNEARDALLLAIAPAGYAALGSELAAAVLKLAKNRPTIENLPPEVWKAVAAEHLGSILSGWNAETVQIALRRWFSQNVHRASELGAAGPSLVAALATVEQGEPRDAALLEAPGWAYLALKSADAAALLKLAAKRAFVEKVPASAWESIGGAELPDLIRGWNAGTTLVLLKRWFEAHPAEPAGLESVGRGLGEAVATLSKEAERDKVLLAIPARAYAALGAEGRGALLQRLTEAATVEALPRSVWDSVPLADMSALLKGAAPAAGRAALSAWLDLNAAKRAGMTSADFVSLLLLLGRDGTDAAAVEPVFEKVSAEAWDLVERADAVRLVSSWSSSPKLAAGIAALWLKRHPAWEDFEAMLGALPASADPGALVAAMPAELFAGLRSPQVLSVLSKIGPESELAAGAERSTYDLVASAAWEKLDFPGFTDLFELWIGRGHPRTASAVMRGWLRAHEAEIGGAELAGGRLARLLGKLAESGARDELIARVSAELAKGSSADVSAALSLVSSDGEKKEGSVYGKIAPDAWRTLSLEDAARLVSHWMAQKYNGTSALVLKRWLAAHEAELGTAAAPFATLAAAISTIEHQGMRDAALAAVPDAALARVDGVGLRPLLAAAGAEAAAALLKRWLAARPADLDDHGAPAARTAALIAMLPDEKAREPLAQALRERWLAALDERLKSSKDSVRSLLDFLRAQPSGPGRDGLLEKIPASAYERMTSQEAFELLLIAGSEEKGAEARLKALPDALWLKLRFKHRNDLVARWESRGSVTDAGLVVRDRWKTVRQSKPSVLSARDRYDLWKSYPEGPSRDEKILSIAPLEWAYMTSAEVADLLSLASSQAESRETPGGFFKRVPEEAWLVLTKDDMKKVLLHRWTEIHNPARTGTAEAIVERWSAARE